MALVIGVIVGAFLAASGGGEITGPMAAADTGGAARRKCMAEDGCWLLVGGPMAFGARMAGACTNGHGISGAMQLAGGSWIALLGCFVGGNATAMLLFYA